MLNKTCSKVVSLKRGSMGQAIVDKEEDLMIYNKSLFSLLDYFVRIVLVIGRSVRTDD